MMPDMNTTTVALLFLLVVLVVAAVSTRIVAIMVSLVAFVCFNFFFLQPVGTFAISKGEDLVALVALLAVSLIGSHLSHQARERAKVALALAHQRNEAELARGNADAKAALVASLSHDLKTPLTALTISVGNLAMPGLSEEERGDQLRLVQTELIRLKRLFDSMIDMASVETRSLTTELEWVHPSDIIEAACQHAEPTLRSRTIDVRDESGDQVVHLDPRITSAALAHVLENAAMYSPGSSPIAIHVSVAGSHLVVEVRDHGPGLPPNELDRIFDRFYRGTGTTPNQFSSGMGLAITRGLIALQGGRIRAANHAESGAVFTLEVPVATRVVSEAAVET
jgi:two-component system, OmpR family, sensor histidine kinase KdpD